MTKVIGLDSNSAVTVFSSVAVPHTSQSEISEADLENYLSKVVWKSFDFLRHEAGSRLNVNEVDLILSGVRVVGIKVDGHEVLNPHGFIGRSLEISVCITMVKRGVLEPTKDKKQEEIEVFEEGSAAAYLLSRSLQLDYLLYVDIRSNVVKMFLVTPSKTSYLTEFSWGKTDIAKAYADYFGVPEETALEMYDKFVQGEASLTVLERMRRIFYSAFKTFIDGLTVNIKNISLIEVKKLPPIYIKSSFPLPEEVFKRAFILGKKRTKLMEVKKEVDISDLVLNPPYNVYEWLNQLAKRRIKWLMP